MTRNWERDCKNYRQLYLEALERIGNLEHQLRYETRLHCTKATELDRLRAAFPQNVRQLARASK